MDLYKKNRKALKKFKKWLQQKREKEELREEILLLEAEELEHFIEAEISSATVEIVL